MALLTPKEKNSTEVDVINCIRYLFLKRYFESMPYAVAIAFG